MPISSPYMVKQVVGDTDLELEAEAGKSLIIRDILIGNPAGDYLTVKIANTAVGYFRIGGDLGSHLGIPIGSGSHSHSVTVAAANGSLTEDHAITDGRGQSQASLALTSDVSALTEFTDIVGFTSIPKMSYGSILSKLARLGIFKGYPVAEGEKFSLSGAKQAGSIQVVIYQEATAGEFKRSDPNGSEAKEYMLLNYGRVAAAITTTTETIYETPQTPVEFANFPYGKDVPANNVITIHGILASDIVFDLGSNDTMISTYLKLVHERTTLFDNDRNGLLLYGVVGSTDAVARPGRGWSLFGNESAIDQKPGLFFTPGLEFKSGEELNVFLATIAGSSQSASDLTAAFTELCLVETIKKK